MPGTDAPARATILLVDDEPSNLELLQAFLEPEALGRLVLTTDPRQVERLLESEQPDLLVLDLHMPGLSGFDILARMRERRDVGDLLPVLVLTADSTPATRERALAGGAHDFLTKPLDALEVVLRVRNLLETRRLFLEQRVAREAAEEGRQRALVMAEQARAASRARDHVLSVVAHDLRNPLAAIAADAEMLEQLLPPGLAARPRTTAARIRRVAARVERHLQDLLDVARLEENALPLRLAPTSVTALVTEARELLQPLARARAIRLTFSGPALPTLAIDAARVVQVLSNLVGNALRFTPEGGRVDVRWCLAAGEALFAVRDTGPGIEPDHLPHLFAPFWQADASERRGAGLGLAIARALVLAHGGRIWAESSPGEGATFHFTLPIAADAAVAGRHA